MSAQSNGRVLRIALAASVAVHLSIAALVYSRPVTAAPEQPPQKTEIFKIKIPPPTPPPPPPKKRALPHAKTHAPAVRPAMKTVHIARTHSDGPPIAPPVVSTGNPLPDASPGPDMAPTSAPVAATPTPKPACSAPEVAAKTIVTVAPDVPDDERNGFTGTAKVKVDLDASGAVIGVSVYEPTGNMQLDRAALLAARESRYTPEERDCKNVAGSYLFTVDFQ